MNDHEAQRLAAAMHEARPDWPTSSVLTLIRKNLMEKPRRDVFVALAWVASEENSHTPARVLESGPWWRAAGVEGSGAVRNIVASAERCSSCSQAQVDCRRQFGGRCEGCDDEDSTCGHHEFESAAMAAKRRSEGDPAATTKVIAALRAGIEPLVVRPVKSLADIEAERPEFAARLAAIQAQHPAPSLQEVQAEPTEGASA